MKIWMTGLVLTTMLALTACVTINIYFPAAAAEKAADKIIDEVWQIKQGEAGGNTETPTEKSTETPEK